MSEKTEIFKDKLAYWIVKIAELFAGLLFFVLMLGGLYYLITSAPWFTLGMAIFIALIWIVGWANDRISNKETSDIWNTYGDSLDHD